ncbi:hypothetical protein L204_101520 [Cryptococcus depauperatus]
MLLVMSGILDLASTALIPLITLTSFTIYLSTHPDSPIQHVLNRKQHISLPTHIGEALNGCVLEEKDPFDIDDPVVFEDGTPVEPEKFWASMKRRKLAIIGFMIPPLLCNTVLLGYSVAVFDKDLDAHQRAIILPALLLPSQIITLLIGFWHLFQNEVASHWATTIHNSVIIFTQFIILALLALLPSTPYPSLLAIPESVGVAYIMRIKSLVIISKALLPILYIPPLVIVLSLRRGPPLYLPLSSIYPSKIVNSVPQDSSSLDPNMPNVSSEVQATVVEWLLFGYATEVIRKGYVAETMDVWDLPILPATLRALPQFRKMKKTYGNPKSPLGRMEGINLLWIIAKVNSGLLWAQTLLASTTAIGYYLPHYLLNLFINYLENDPSRSEPAWGWFLCFGMFLSNALVFVATGITWSISSTYLQGKIRLQLNTMLFKKTLLKKDVASGGEDRRQSDTKKTNNDKKREQEEQCDEDEEEVNSKTQIMTLFTVDVDHVTEFVFHLFAIVDSPLEVIIASFFLFKLLGISAMYGLLTAILFLPLNHFATKIVVEAEENLMKTRDQRTALMNEILQGIRMLKFMAWERSFEKRVRTIRKSELSFQAKNYQIEVAFICIWALTPVMVTVVSFLHYTLVNGQRLTPSVAFTSVAVFAELRFALNAIPVAFIDALQGFVSCKRIEKYLSLAEVPVIEESDGLEDIILSSATYTWPRNDLTHAVDEGLVTRSTITPKNSFTLANLNLRFPRGKLSLICGRLGSGKSLLLNGLLGEADLLTGCVTCPRSSPDVMDHTSIKQKEEAWIIPNMTAYVPQQTWLQNASIKDNIIFSAPWDPDRYRQVIDVCSLTADLKILEDGDQTEIGEQGLNLSGGQKARVSLARAIYSRAGVLLLDDVLSAVDAHTANAIMLDCLQGPMIENRTIIIVSHHTALVSPTAAYIVALENGNVKYSGTRDDFVALNLMEQLEEDKAGAKFTEGEQKEEKTIEENFISSVQKSVVSLSSAVAASTEPNSETSSLAPEDQTTLANSMPDLKPKPPRKLIEDEKRAQGRIAWNTWKTYFTSLGGPTWWILFVFSLGLAMVVPVAERGWLEYWTGSGSTSNEGRHTIRYYVIGYSLISVVGVFVSSLQYAMIYYGSLQASRKFHNAMLESVLFSTLRFHDTTSRGRLLNRFGKDIEGLDSSTAEHFIETVAYGLNVVVTFVSIVYVGGLPFVLAGFIVLIVYYQVGSIYGQTSRDMRRLDSITQSPLYSLFGETISGIAVLRAFGASTLALKNMMRLADTNLLAFAWSWTVNRWLSARFNLLSAVMIGLTGVAVLIAPNVDAAMAGFALAFAGTLCQDLLQVVRSFVQLEQSMVAIERLKEYTELAREAPEFVEPRPPAAWPALGSIQVENLVIKYAPDLPSVLHHISFEIAPRQKIGIVGSTGCGKSTLALSFFRFVEATEGRIIIDDIDISKIGLTDLRSRVTIIPQDPTILSGTLRSTLDVFDEYDDVEIFEALRRVHLIKDGDFVTPAEGEGNEADSRNKNIFLDLSNNISESGDNLSSGEKQLVCMARAILKRNKILFMDEATASIDHETDVLISKTIREEFLDSTVLTIAHRIHTIIDFDKVLVMDQGNIAEFDSPAELIRDHKSRFYALCKATGRTEFRNLKNMAIEAEKKRLSA